YSAMNSLGLKLNGIGKDTRPRAGGIEILRDASGEPTGVFVEHNFVNMLERDLLPAVPRFTYEQRREGIRRGIGLYNAKGTTSIYEGHGSSADIVAAYRELWERGELNMRVGLVISPAWTGLEEAERLMRDWLPLARGRGFGDAMLRISGVFIGYGGDPWIRELARKNYSDVAWSGLVPQANSPEEFEALCLLAARYGLRVHTVVSDKLHEIVPIMERIAREYPIGERRWVLEHVSKATEADLVRVQRLGVGVTLIPPHYVWKVGHRFFGLDAEQLDLLSPARRLFKLGVPVSAGTDAVPYDPLFCMWVMTTRRERTTNRVMGEGGIVTNEVALRLLTVGGAWLTFDEERKGPLAVGHYADLAVLSGNPLAARGDELLALKCLATMVDGRWVHSEL
ncbi:MAG TPA: amidohydrolase family protein, partial [Burkholderiales bacterium]